jgi:two-component system, LytTR family, response regulator
MTEEGRGAITTLVVDDEAESRAGLLALLRKDAEIEVVGEAASGPEAIAALEAHRPELLLLDVQMPGVDGFGVLAALPPAAVPVVVFVTAYDAYALRAFAAHAQEYLLKPFADERFAEALAHAKSQVRQRRVGRLGRRLAAELERERPEAPALAPPSEKHSDRVMVRDGHGVAFVPVAEIDWIEARNYCARLHVGAREYLVRESLSSLIGRLDPARFVRIHRSSIINLDRLHSLEPYFHGSYVVKLRDGTRLTLSRSRRAALERALGTALR